MSSGINWTQLGVRAQTQATSELEARQKSEEAARKTELDAQQRELAVILATEKIMGDIHAECKRIADLFNAGIKDTQLTMIVGDETRRGTGIISFAVSKNSGFPKTKIVTQEGKITVTLSPGRATNDRSESTYTVTQEGIIFASTPPMNRTASNIAEAACNALVGTNYAAPLT